MINLSSLPTDPGCYIYKNKAGIIIYIGKAKNIKKRVSSYFQKKDHDPKTTQLVRNIDSLDYIITNSEKEALILENNLIKKHKPKYNIDLKDSKRYAYILITDEEFPRLRIARDKKSKGTYCGPFTSGQERDYIIRFLNNTFQLRTCKHLPKKPCLRYHINLCNAPCINEISKKEYNERISYIKQILKGKTKETIKSLLEEMKVYAKNQQFELALTARNRIAALERLSEKQQMEKSKSYNEDIINYIIKNHTVYLILFNIKKGTLVNKQEFTFSYQETAFEEFLLQYYSEETIPKEIILPKSITKPLQEVLEEMAKKKLVISIPKIGDKKKLLDLIIKNIEQIFLKNVKKVEELMKKLKMNEMPEVIECFDISHLSGTSTVASMVQFRNGKPDKSNYRRFKIRTVDGIDDFKSMYEVVSRRYRRILKENGEFPNLIIIDGGKGQLSSSVEALQELGIRLPIISVAKREEEIFVPGLSNPIIISKKEIALQYIQEIRDEAHRFAITYNRLLRKKKLFEET